MDRRKNRGGKSHRRGRARGKKMQVGEEVLAKSWNTIFFPPICGSGGWTNWLAKAAGAEQPWEMRDEQLHAVVARSTCGSQKGKKPTISDHVWSYCKRMKKCTPLRQEARLEFRTTFLEVDMSKKCTPLCFVLKSKCTKHTMLGPLLEVDMLKNVRGLSGKHMS